MPRTPRGRCTRRRAAGGAAAPGDAARTSARASAPGGTGECGCGGWWCGPWAETRDAVRHPSALIHRVPPGGSGGAGAPGAGAGAGAGGARAAARRGLLLRRAGVARAGRAAGGAAGGVAVRGAVVGAVEARTLEDHTDGVEELAQPAVAGGADGQRVVGEALELLEGVVALGAGVLVRGHGRFLRWSRGVRALALAGRECQ